MKAVSRWIDNLLQCSPLAVQAAKQVAKTSLDLDQDTALNRILAEHFLELTTQDWISKLEPLGILCTKINSYEEAAEDPQLRVNQMILETVHPRADAVNVLGTPLRIQNYERRSRKNAPPELGEHNHEILRELGYTNKEIQEFEQLGVFG